MSDIEIQPQLLEIDVTKLDSKLALKHRLDANSTYLLLTDGRFVLGKFNEERTRFQPCALASMSLQVGYPFRDNSLSGSSFQRLWKFVNADAISAADERRYAENARASAIRRKLTSNGVTIDETAPLEAFVYDPKVEAMPRRKLHYVPGHYEDDEGNIVEWDDE